MLEREDIFINKRNGETAGPYKAIFAGGTIVIDDAMANIAEGDTILRRLPNGMDERSTITEATFFNKGTGSIGAHYQVKFSKGVKSSSAKLAHHINITGAQSVQIGDYNTQNIINSFEELIERIEATDASSGEKAEVKSLMKNFLEHPLVVAVVGAVAGSVVS